LLSRLLILLCIIGWVEYIDLANSNRSGDPAAQDSKAFAARSPDTQTAKSTDTQLQPIASAAAQSPHAIIPGATPPLASANSPAPPPKPRMRNRYRRPIKSLHPSRGLVSSQKNNSGSRRKRAYEAAHPIRLN